MKFIIIVFIVNIINGFVYAEDQSVISYTTKNKRCMSACVPYKNYQYCYLSSGWDYCERKLTDQPTIQYYTHIGEPCNGQCVTDGNGDVHWCYTGDTYYAKWKECSPRIGYTIKLDQRCHRQCAWEDVQSSYTCTDNFFSELLKCSPTPHNLTLLRLLSDDLLSHTGRYTSTGKFESCSRSKRLSENAVRTIGVEELAARYHKMYPPTPTDATISPITMVATADAPHVNYMRDVRVTFALQATIRPQHLRTRDGMGSFVAIHMENMQALPSDERGHLLASSLGGPSVEYNFAPQTAILNRAAHGMSYWYTFEDEMRTFLRDNNNGYINWTLIITYDLNTSRRPTGFGLRIRMYDNQNVEQRDTDNCYFSNDPRGGCPI